MICKKGFLACYIVKIILKNNLSFLLTSFLSLYKVALSKRQMPKLKKVDNMNLYNVTFTNGETMQEYGDDVADLKQFFARCYPHLVIAKIELF